MPAGADGDQDILGGRQALDLTGEQLVNAVVIADSRQHGGVGGKGEGGIRPPFTLKPSDKLGRDMLSICGTAAVATEQEFLASLDRSDDHLRGRMNRW
jgi:hypothetical protein